MPEAGNQPSDFSRVAAAIHYLEAHADDQPGLEELAGAAGLSPSHFQRLFKRWAGVSPKRFLQFLTIEHAKKLLRDSNSVLDTSFEVGLSGPGRLHDLFVSVEAVTPGEYKAQGEGLEILWGLHDTPFGRCLLATTPRGVCHLSFPADDGAEGLERLNRDWGRARLIEDPAGTRTLVEDLLFAQPQTQERPLGLVLKGTNFQIKVWNALLQIPRGRAVSYGNIAAHIGSPHAHRAVGTAVGANPIAWLIPCHRVLRKGGELGGYRWGTTRKRAMIGWEATHPQEAAKPVAAKPVTGY
jgi:AraC family transcriptional regulator of adaptative response/methylated-DNA-[protein]-cysteine methyltransferase